MTALRGLWPFIACAALSAAPAYDPLAVAKPAGKKLELSVTYSGRAVPVLVYLPVSSTPAPVLLFSHGLGGSRHGSAYLGEHWSARGYVCVFLQHPGSDEAVWRGKPLRQRMSVLRDAATGANLQHRVKDVPAVLDQLDAWNRANGHALHNRLDLAQVGMSGHSFGALTTQAVSGQNYGRLVQWTDPRIKAALPMSPSAPARGDAKMAFSKVEIPWLLMTGTKDTAAIGNATVESRLAVFPALPPGDKYELVLLNAEHSAFTERPLPGDKESRNPNHHRAILALSTAFWDAFLRKDQAAVEWLIGDGPTSVLESGDRWRKK